MSENNSVSPCESASSSGDPGQWVEEHGDVLYRYAYYYFRDDALVEDLIQDTFLVALKGLEKFKGDSSVRTWLTGILKHKIYDQLRRKVKGREVLASSDAEDGFTTLFDDLDQWANYEQMRPWGQSPDKFFEQKEFLKVLGQCSEKLPARLRQVQLMRDVEDLPQDEICNMLDLSSSNLRVILHRARLLLRDCLETNWRMLQPEGEGFDFL